MEPHCHLIPVCAGMRWRGGLVSMRESKAEPMKVISELVDACNHCSELFFIGSVSNGEPESQQLALKICRLCELYEFELRTEIRRLGGTDIGSSPPEPIPHDSEIIAGRAEIALQLALEQYQQALQAALPAHARAMINRQYTEIEQAYQQLASVQRAA